MISIQIKMSDTQDHMTLGMCMLVFSVCRPQMRQHYHDEIQNFTAEHLT